MDVRDEDFDNVNPGEARVLVPQEASYPARFIDYESRHYGSWGEKLIFQWNVFTSYDKSMSVILPRYYNLARRGGGQFRFGPLHDYRKDWVAANGGRHPFERSRLPISIWKDRLYLVQVVTVRHDSKGRPLSPSLYWSKIGWVVRPLEESDCWERLRVQQQNSKS